MKTVLSIAGSDPSGGAGIQADLKTMEAHGVYGMSVITALTAQNTLGVQGVMEIPADYVKSQITSVFDDIYPNAVKIGMLPNLEVMKAVVMSIDKYKAMNIVLDPVMSSTSGTELSRKDSRKYMIEELFPRCTLVTPNIPETEVIISLLKDGSGGGNKPPESLDSREKIEEAGKKIGETCGCNVLIKGGHSSFAVKKSMDYLYLPDKKEGIWLEGERLDNPNTHGTGCTLSSAIASNLALGYDLEEAVRKAKRYLEKCIRAGLDLGHGRGPLLHRV